MNKALLAMLLGMLLASPAHGANQVIELTCRERLVWGYHWGNGNYQDPYPKPHTVRYTIDLARQRWKSTPSWNKDNSWNPFQRTTGNEIYLISNGVRQLILRRSDLQIVLVTTQEWQDGKEYYGVAVEESRCRRLPTQSSR